MQNESSSQLPPHPFKSLFNTLIRIILIKNIVLIQWLLKVLDNSTVLQPSTQDYIFHVHIFV